MRLRRYTASDLPEAMARIRQSLGPDAIILSTDEEPGGGVLVTAAVESEESGGEANAGDELDPGSVAFLQKLLVFHRPPRKLVDSLLERAAAMPAAEWTLALRQALAERFAFKALEIEKTERPIMLVGLPGAGKTAAAAKLALAARLAGRPVALITLDGEKAGGLAQIRHFAAPLDARVTEVETADQLAGACAAAAEDAVVLIDSPGCNPFAASALAALEGLAAAAAADLLHVIAAGGDSLDAAEVGAAFAGIGAEGLLLAKTDSARRFGGVLSAAEAGGQALVAFSDSPRIDAGLRSLTPESLADILATKAAEALHVVRVTEAT